MLTSDLSELLPYYAVISAAAVVIGSFFFISRRNNGKKAKTSSRPPLLPEGPPIQEFGNVNKKYQLNRFQLEWAKNYGINYLVKSPLKLVIPDIAIVGDPKVAKQLLFKEAHSHRRRFTTRDQLMSWAIREGEGDSISAATGAEWLWRRQAIQKEFHKSRMGDARRGLLGKLVEIGDNLCDMLQEAGKAKEPVRVDHLTTQVSVEVILFFIFGRCVPFNFQTFSASAYQVFRFMVHCGINPFHYFLRYIPFSSFWKMDRMRDAAWKVIDNVIREEVNIVLQEFESKKSVPDRNYGAALPSLLEKEPRYRERGIESLIVEIRVLTLAGFETTAHALSFACGMLASHPEIADRIAKEGKSVWKLLHSGDSESIQLALDAAPTARKLFMEASRFYPPIYMLAGKCLEDIVISTSKEDEQYLLEKGTQVLFANMVLNRADAGDALNLDLWDLPREEQPFLNTFNNGEHVCPGKALSLVEAHVFLLMVATKFRFSFPGGEPCMDAMDHIMLKPVDGMPLLVTER